MRNSILVSVSVVGALLALSCDTSPRPVAQASAVSSAPCRSRADCARFEFCLAPGEFAGCGTCFIGDDCSTDSDCQAYGPTFICDSAPCSCRPTCVPGCTSDSGCRTGQSCGADYRCAPSACQVGADCPVNFVCTGSSDLRCARKPCVSDSECQGYCVNQLCYDALGACTQPPV